MLSALSTGRVLLPKNVTFLFVVLISITLSKPQGLVQPEGFGKLRKLIHFIETRTRNLQARSIVPYALRYRVPATVSICKVAN
jgi:hypothetical protein